MLNIFNLTFSPTGGTQRVADRLASALGETFSSFDLCDRLSNPASLQLNKDSLCVVAIPSYGGRIPAVAAERIARLRGNGALAVLLCVYGNRAYDDTLLEMKDLLEQSGFTCIAAVAAIAEHSILRQYAAGRPDAQDLAELDAFGKKILEKIASGDPSNSLSVPGNRPYRALGSFMKPAATDECIGCGVCADLCPVGAIDAENPRTTDQEKCAGCMRCVSVCPVKARELPAAMLEAVNARIGKALGGYKRNELFL